MDTVRERIAWTIHRCHISAIGMIKTFKLTKDENKEAPTKP